MEPDLVLGIDCSTTASKAVAWDESGNVVAEGRVAIALLAPQTGWGEQDARDWWTATAGATGQVTATIDSARIAAICITHQRESFVPVDANGRPSATASCGSTSGRGPSSPRSTASSATRRSTR